MIWASQLDYQFKDNIELQFISKYVDEQFIDNTSSAERKLDSYLIHHARLIWDIESELFKSARLSFKSITCSMKNTLIMLGFIVLNLIATTLDLTTLTLQLIVTEVMIWLVISPKLSAIY